MDPPGRTADASVLGHPAFLFSVPLPLSPNGVSDAVFLELIKDVFPVVVLNHQSHFSQGMIDISVNEGPRM